MTSKPALTKKFISRSAADTKKFGARLARALRPGDVILMTAPLGAGKTTFVQGLVKALGIKDEALSPTFVVAQTLQGKKPVHHLDFYRLSAAEILAMGIQDYLLGSGEIGKGIVLIEWAERCKEIWPRENLRIKISIDRKKDTREIEMFASGGRYVTVLSELKNQ